ncbi:MAG: glycosyltransferase [Candidatus Levybacteria bacterium]|nr:glycosyltransferase [Candidatus Levybacteria bacterium]
MAKLKISLVCTILNEEKTIEAFIDSVIASSVIPNELIITDGGSKDKTETIVKKKAKEYSKKLKIKFILKKGNRSVGRNEGIEKARNDLILLTDSGCLLDKDWVKNILKPFEKDSSIDVASGYYNGKYKNIFEKSLIPYALVMEDKVDSKNFLPATRSMAIKREVWKKLGGFDEKLSHNEDFAFANKIKNAGYKIKFQKNAIVYWLPRTNLNQAFKMFFRFALGDIQANIIRDKVIYIILRYIFVAYLLFLVPILKSNLFNLTLFLIGFFYISWSVNKNYKYVNDPKALIYLPLLQFTSDIAVISATVIGVAQKFSLENIIKVVKSNKGVFSIIFVYSALMLYLIQWGIPNQNHPFNYAMDEWHFSQSLRALFSNGTALISGSANIPFYHVVSSIIFLIPFYLASIVNPFVIKNALDSLLMQHTLFEILRLHTLLYGVLSVIVLYKMFKEFIGRFSSILVSLFVFTPIWLLLTNYYKYDIALVFWILMTLYLIIKYGVNGNINHFILAGISCGLALSTKFTAAPLFVLYFLSYCIFTKKINLKHLLISCLVVLFVFAFAGIPDIVFGKGNYFELINSTLVQGPKTSTVYNIENPVVAFLMLKEFPAIFGYFLTISFYISIVISLILIFFGVIKRKVGNYRLELFLLLGSLLFLLSTVSFNLDGGGNRALVLLPFMVLLPAAIAKRLVHKKEKVFYVFLIMGLLLQVVQSLSWISVKVSKDPREVSSTWILKNIPANSQIGIENIPIYQMLPDFILKEYYLRQRDSELVTRYQYSVISASDKVLPKYVIVSNDFNNVSYIKSSPKKDLVERLNKENYKKIQVFSPNLKYYNLFADNIYFIVTNIIQSPVSISVYEK